MTQATAGETLLRAQQEALSHDERLDTLDLAAIRGGVPDLPVAGSVIAAKATLTITGASTLEITLHDPGWLVERSGLLDTDDNGRMNAIRVTVDALPFRLVKASRQDPSTLVLTFEDEAVALMRVHNKPHAWSRGKVTRAQAIGWMVKEVRLPFWSPEQGHKQPVELPNYPDTAPAAGDTGFDKGVKVKVKGITADAAQMRELATVMGVCDEEDVSPRVRLAELVAAIGESGARAIPNARGSGYEGVFQADPKNIPRTHTADQARAFLKGGQGFQAGGAIQLARENPSMTAGTIATKVEASGEQGSFYDAYHDEAKAIADVWNSGTGAKNSSVLRVKAFQFTRGQPGQKETSWDAGTRLAGEVNWRLFSEGGVIWFASDDYLISKPASLILDGFDAPGLLAPPTYDWDHGKLAGNIGLTAAANRWAVRPGEVVACRDMGPVTGRWITETIEIDLLSAVDTQVTLIKPLAAHKEPAPDVSTTASAKGNATGYVDPFKGAAVTASRVDQGVDYGVQGPIRAIGDAIVLAILHYDGFGTYLVYQLKSGPHRGKYVYVSEGITPTAQPGEDVRAGHKIADGHGGIETGWAQGPPSYLPIAQIKGGYGEGDRTKAGDHFNELMVSLGVVRGTTGGRPVRGHYP